MEDFESLDPEDPAAFRAAAHRLLDACLDRLEGARELPWRPIPEAEAAGWALRDGAPGLGEAETARRLAEEVAPFATGNTHPRFFGWVHGTGLASGLLSGMVAAAMNANCGGRDHGAVRIEREVIDWTRRVMGLPEGAGGVLTTGTSQATVLALAAARRAALGERSRRRGTEGAALVAYAGPGVHAAAVKAMELLGLGAEALVRPEGGLTGEAVRAAATRDRAAGRRPFAVLATAGSVDTGAFDDLEALAEAAAAEGLWLHVDGAFGAWTRLAGPPWDALAAGIGRADSLALDYHKWPYVQYDCGCVLTREAGALTDAFGGRPAYLEAGRALAAGAPWPCEFGIDLSRRARALDVWAAVVCHGEARLGRAIAGNCRRAAEMAAAVAARPPMAVLAPVVSNICVFTADAGAGPEAQSALNAEIAARLQLSGEAVFSTTRIGGVTALRAAIANHRTRPEDVTGAVAAVARARGEIAAGGDPGGAGGDTGPKPSAR